MGYEDGRLTDLYTNAVASKEHCAWSDVFVSTEPPYHESVSVASVILDTDEHVHGTVTATVLLEEMHTLIQEISATMATLSMVIVNGNDNRVIAASEGGNAHPLVETCSGKKEVELYTLEEYADVVKIQSGNRYNYLLQYLEGHPEFLQDMEDHRADISNEDLYHYYATHGHFLTTNDGIMLVAGMKVVDKCGLYYRLYIILSEEELVMEITAQNKQAHEDIQNITMRILIGVFVGCFACNILGMGLARAISYPLRVIRNDINLIAELDFSGTLTKFRPFVTELKEMIDQYMKLKLTLCDFNCFVPPHVLDELVDLGDEAIERTAVPKEIGVLFVYVSNFSAASHNSDNSVVADFANQFIGEAADLLSNMSGTVIDFFGDSLFGIFNAPYDDPDYVKNAMECAHEIIILFERVKAEFMSVSPDFELLRIRVGLHCGDSLVGKIGSKSRLKYCAVGDTVNLGSRIENMNRRYNSQLVCSSDFFNALDDKKEDYVSRPMEYVKVQGRSEPVLIYEIGGMINSVEQAKLEEFKAHSDLFFAIRAGQAGTDELEAHIKKYGGNAEFLRSAGISTAELKEIKKLE